MQETTALPEDPRTPRANSSGAEPLQEAESGCGAAAVTVG